MMAEQPLPPYLASAKANPVDSRAPWYKTTAPSYAGIFLWIAFYDSLGKTLNFGGVAASLLGLVLAVLICYFLFYKVFGMLGMKTGMPLYVVGSSTFGTKGGYLFPGIFMGILQIGWYSVGTYYATKLLMGGFGAGDKAKTIFDVEPAQQGFSLLFVILAIAWGYIFALVGAKGIEYVGKISQFFPIIPLVMLLVTAIAGLSTVGEFEPPAENPSSLVTICLMIQMVVGFYATAGAAGVDFGLNNRDERDVNLGGLVGVSLIGLVAGGLAILTVAGALGKAPDLGSFLYSKTISAVMGEGFTKIFLILFAIGSMAPACFCSFIIGNSLSTMLPGLPRTTWTMLGATGGIIIAALGLAGHLEPFFGLIGASFGPICGAMVADYLLSGRKWNGPRAGVNPAGYISWIIGFVVGVSNNSIVTGMLGTQVLPGWHPTAVYSFIVGFVLYAILAKAGMEPEAVALPGVEKEPLPEPEEPTTAPQEIE
jgi:cytosine permease